MMNKKSATCLLVLIVAVTALAGCGDRRDDRQRLQDAQANIDAGNYRAAIVDLKNVLRADPQNVDVRLALGRATLLLGDPAAAEKELARARDLGADPDEFAVPLARSILQRGGYAEIIAEFEPARLSDPGLADTIRAFRGRALLELDSPDEARTVFEALLANDQTTAEARHVALLGKARLARRSGELTAAEDFVRRSLDVAPDSAESTLMLGEILFEQGNAAGAEEVFSWGRDNLQGTRLESFMLAAGAVEALLAQNKADEALARATELVSGPQPTPRGGLLMARAQIETGDLDGAAERLRQLIAKAPGYAAAQVLLGAVALELGDYQQAEMVLASVLSDRPGHTLARRLLAETQLKTNRPDEAAQTLRRGGGNPAGNTEMLTLMGRTELSRGNADQAIALLEQSHEADPGNLRTAQALISAYLSVGQRERAIDLINSIPAQDLPAQRREVMLLVAGIDLNEVAESVARVDELVARWPDDTAIMSVAAGLYTAAAKTTRARAIYQRLHELVPDDRGVVLNIVRLDANNGDFARARGVLEEYLQAHPDDTMTLLALSNVAANQGDAAAAEGYLRRASDADPDALMPNVLLANQALQSGDLEAARRFGNAALSANPDSASAHATVGFTELRAGNAHEALGYLRKATELDTTVALFQYYRGMAELQMGMLPQARSSFDKVLAIDTSHSQARRALMMLEAKSGNAERAEALLAELQENDPGSAVTLEAEGDLRLEQGRTADAVAAYEQAQAMYPNRRLAKRIFEVRKRAGLGNALAPLVSWIEDHPDDEVMRLLYAQDLQASGQTAQAITQYEKILELNPGNPLVLNNLAWVYLEQNDAPAWQQAMEVARRAHQAVPDNLQIADTYGWALFKAGYANDGKRVLEAAIGAREPSTVPELAYHLAAILNQQGDSIGARRLLNKALESDTDFYGKADARELLKVL